MTEYLLKAFVPDLIIDHPEMLIGFQKCGIDFSCVGKSLFVHRSKSFECLAAGTVQWHRDRPHR